VGTYVLSALAKELLKNLTNVLFFTLPGGGLTFNTLHFRIHLMHIKKKNVNCGM
jgi:hypothetical protein